MPVLRLTLTCLLLALALPANAAIYTYIDAKGNKVYTNQPPDGMETKTLDLPPVNTVNIKVPTPPASSDNPAQNSQAATYSLLRLGDLPSDEALRANNGTFSVSVHVEPALKPGHLLRLLLDGQPHGQVSNVPRLQLTEVERGDHSLVVEVLNGGQSIQQSAPQTFTVQRVNTSSPALRAPGKAP